MLKKIKNIALLSLILASLGLSAQENIDEDLDVMSDFAYPISMMQSIRENINQSLYFLQEGKLDRAINLLQEATSNLQNCTIIKDDDRTYISVMIHQMQVLIATINNDQDQSALVDLCQQVLTYV